jgi:hypothetical protein
MHTINVISMSCRHLEHCRHIQKVAILLLDKRITQTTLDKSLRQTAIAAVQRASINIVHHFHTASDSIDFVNVPRWTTAQMPHPWKCHFVPRTLLNKKPVLWIKQEDTKGSVQLPSRAWRHKAVAVLLGDCS